MIERTQPIVSGLDQSGELVWVTVAMPRWQMELIRVRYCGDFMAHWMKKQYEDNTGRQADPASPSMELRAHKRHTRPIHDGD